MKKLIIVLLALLLPAAVLAEGTGMKYDFSTFTNVTLKGIDISTLNEDELSAMYQAARYCQAMTEADIDTMRDIVSEDMTFTHMSGMTQTREEYFADVEDGSLTYYAIGMENPVVEVDGDMAMVTYTSALDASAYGRPTCSPDGGPRVSDASCGSAAALASSASLRSALYAQGTFRMKGTHYYQRIDGEWIAVNRHE